MEADDQHTYSFYQQLPRAKTLCERGEAKLVSLFRLGRLPLEVDSCTTVEEPTAEITQQHPPDIGTLQSLPSSKLHELFAKPVYQSNTKFLQTESNEGFGQLRCRLRDLTTQQLVLEQDSEPQSNTIEFESRFESGNLAMAAQLSDNEYTLLLQKDINTNSCTQWFFFRVRNRNRLGRVRFSIVNMTKKYSAYENGMKVCVFSRKEHEKMQKGWSRGCDNISYCRNNVPRSSGSSYYTLSFEYDFQQRQDQVYFANSYPYSYSRLQRYLDEVEHKHPKILHRRRLGDTVSGNFLELVAISNFQDKSTNTKPMIFITARVHPGETISSYVCDGLINFLLSNTKEADGLRNQFVFKIMPMMNPDGVVNGNYRCSLFGKDLNRQWRNPDKALYPENHLVKKLIADSEGDRLAYIDLHGHSKKRGVFMYGCRSRENPYECREIPFLMHKLSKMFNYYGCNFNVSKVRDGTGRVTVWRDFKIAHSFTLESSLFGPAAKFKANFVKVDYRHVGEDLARVFYQYFYRHNQSKYADANKPDALKQLYTNSELLAVGNSPSEGSSSAESLEQEVEKELKPDKIDIPPLNLQKEMSSTVLSRRSPREHMSSMSQDYYKPRRFQQTDRYAPYETTRPGKNSFLLPKPTGLKIPSINELKMDGSLTTNTFRKNYEIIKRHSEVSSGLQLPKREESPLRQEPPTLGNRFDMTSIVFPSALRNEYTNYQRYRREQVDFSMLFSGQAGIVRNRQPRNPKQAGTNRRILDRIKNKKEIRSVSRRPERRLQQKILDLL